jgi:hypothetical protein
LLLEFFFEKGFKKLNLKRGAVLEIFEKWVPPAQSTGGRRGTGNLLPIERAGGAKFFPRRLPRAFSRIKFFFIREEAPKASRPTNRRDGQAVKASRPANGREVHSLFSFFWFKFMF